VKFKNDFGLGPKTVLVGSLFLTTLFAAIGVLLVAERRWVFVPLALVCAIAVFEGVQVALSAFRALRKADE